MNRVCKYCGETFDDTISKKKFAAHVKWCKKNPRYLEIRNNQKLKHIKYQKDRMVKKYGEFKNFEVICHMCHKKFTVTEYVSRFSSKKRYYCSEHCRATYANSFVDYNKIAAKYYLGKTNNVEYKRLADNSIVQERTCEYCSKKFITKTARRFCCVTCSKKSFIEKIKKSKQQDYIKRYESLEGKKKHDLDVQHYRLMCNFNFSLKNYPDEFDFDLVRKYGWYKPKNHGNNLNGVSRDHMYSVMEGFRNGIDPKIISHPANCRLIQHNENVSKKDSCSITLQELIQRIDIWDKKYNKQ